MAPLCASGGPSDSVGSRVSCSHYDISDSAALTREVYSQSASFVQPRDRPSTVDPDRPKSVGEVRSNWRGDRDKLSL